MNIYDKETLAWSRAAIRDFFKKECEKRNYEEKEFVFVLIKEMEEKLGIALNKGALRKLFLGKEKGASVVNLFLVFYCFKKEFKEELNLYWK